MIYFFLQAIVLRLLASLPANDARFFCECHDLGRDTQRDSKTGKNVTFNYIVMALVGKSVDKLVAEHGNRLSPGSAIGISIQLLNGLRIMHNKGYLHRDIKPANMAVGRADKKQLRQLFVLDFGMARKYTKEDVSSFRSQLERN